MEPARYDNPAADISVPNHRTALAERYDAIGEAAPINTVVSRVTDVIASDDAPANEGLTTTEIDLEAVVLLESEPEAVPTFDGIVIARDIPAGDHRLTVNGAGRAPHSERVTVSDDGAPTAAGVDGEIPLVARDRATKLEVGDERGTSDLSRVAVEDDFAGRLYESAVDGRDAVYVDRGGAYTTEVRDADDAIGAYRVNPDPDAESAVRIERPETGKASLAAFVAEVTEETRAEIAAIGDDDDGDGDDGAEYEDNGSSNAVTGLERSLAAVVDAARRAAERRAPTNVGPPTGNSRPSSNAPTGGGATRRGTDGRSGLALERDGEATRTGESAHRAGTAGRETLRQSVTGVIVRYGRARDEERIASGALPAIGPSDPRGFQSGNR